VSAHRIDFLQSRRTPLLGWLLLVAGMLASGQAARLEQRLEATRDSHDRAQAQLEHDEEQARQRLMAASLPTPESHRLAGAAAEIQRPWLAALRSVEGATSAPVYILDFSIDPAKGHVHLGGESPDFDQAVGYVEHLASGAGVTGTQLSSNEQVTEPGSGRMIVKFTVDANWSVSP
jgi:hypothetical protein